MVEHVPEECPYCRVDILRERPPFWRQRDTIVIASSGILFAVGLLLELLEISGSGALLLFIIAAIIPGFFIARRSVRSIRRGNLDVHVLMMIAAVGAFLIGYEAEGVAVLLLFYIAEFLEDYAGSGLRDQLGNCLN